MGWHNCKSSLSGPKYKPFLVFLKVQAYDFRKEGIFSKIIWSWSSKVSNHVFFFFFSLEEYQITFNNQIYLGTYSLSKNHFADIMSLFEMTTNKFVYFLVFQGYDNQIHACSRYYLLNHVNFKNGQDI